MNKDTTTLHSLKTRINSAQQTGAPSSRILRLARNFFKAALASQLDIDICTGPKAHVEDDIRIVVGNCAANVVEDMGLRKAIGSVSTNPTREPAAVAEEVTVESCKSTTGKSERSSTIVWEKRISVLEESD